MEELVELIINPNTREFGIRLLSDTLGLEEEHRIVQSTPFVSTASFRFNFDRARIRSIRHFISEITHYFRKRNVDITGRFTHNENSFTNMKLNLIFHNLEQ